MRNTQDIIRIFLINELLFCYKIEKGELPALFVIGMETYSDIKESGSRRKASVERPETMGKMPDLAFKAPTCFTGIQVLFYTARWVFLSRNCGT